MRTCDQIQPLLSEFVDDGLVGDAAARTAAHVERCPDCRAVVDDLNRLRDAARALGPQEPPGHIWLEVAGQIRLDETDHSPNRPAPVVVSPPRPVTQWLGLAAVLVIVTLGIFLVQRTPAPGAGNPSPAGSVEVVATELQAAMEHYERAIAELELMAESGETPLDPVVAATLAESLGAVDGAIAESRQALADDPGSRVARDSLFEALQQKIGLLQTTVSIVNGMPENGGAPSGSAGGRSSL